MTTPEQILDAAKAQAQAAVEARMQSVRDLVDADAHAVRLAAELDAAVKHHKTLWRAATKAGWTAEELKKIGLTDPTNKTTRKRAPRTQSPAAAAEPQAQNPDH